MHLGASANDSPVPASSCHDLKRRVEGLRVTITLMWSKPLAPTRSDGRSHVPRAGREGRTLGNSVALDGNGISHDSKLSDGGTNVAVPGNLERLLGKVHDAVDFHGTPTNDQIRLTGNR
jgi:hypothetical protein